MVQNYIDTNNMTDIWRERNKNDFAFAYKRMNPTKALCRLDYFLVTRIAGWTNACYIRPGFRSDHSVLGLNIVVDKMHRGRGFWKLNTELLEDEIFVQTAKDKIHGVLDQDSITEHNAKWELVKLEIAT